MNSFTTLNTLLLINLSLMILSMLYLWLPLTFKFLRYVWFIYSLRIIVPLIMKVLINYPAIKLAMLMADIETDSLISFVPEKHVDWSKPFLYYRKTFRWFLILTVIIIIPPLLKSI